MLSCSKFSDLEQWLCTPSSLLLSRTLDSTSSSSGSSICSSSSSSLSKCCPSSCREPRETDPALRSSEWEESSFSTASLRTEMSSSVTPPPPPVLSSTPVAPAADPQRGGRKRRRLAASPGGLRWNSAGSVQRDMWSPDLRGGNPAAGRGRSLSPAERGGAEWAVWRKTRSVDEWLLQAASRDRSHLRAAARLDRGRKKVHGVQGLATSGRYDSRKKRLPAVVTRQMQNLQLAQSRKCPGGPASPSAAKRLYRNLSEKLRGSTSSFEDAYFFGRTDRFRKASTMQGAECVFEAVEHQDLDAVQILLFQFSPEDLDLNTPNSQGLTPLDVAIMTNNTPIAKLLLRAGAKESPRFVTMAIRDAHLNALVLEAEQRAADLAAQAQRNGLSLDDCHKDKQLRAWEWRSKLYRRMRAGLQHALPPEAPSSVRLSVSSSSTLSVTFQEPHSLHAAVVTRYRVEWSCLKDFSLLAGEMVLDNLQTLKCIISGLTTGRLYYVRMWAYNMKGWGPAAPSQPPAAAPSCWRDGDDSRRRGHLEAMERLLQQVRATHTHYCCGDGSRLQNSSRKPSVSRSLKHLFNSSSKFVKTLKRGVYLAAVFYHQDRLLVTAEEQLPIVEVDDSYSSSFTTDFLWFTKLSCMWEDVRWLRQSSAVSSSSSSTLQARHRLLAAASQLQSLLGTHDLGRVHYEPIKDRHGNILLVTIRDTNAQHALFSGKWLQVTKLQSQRKSLSTPEEPYALDILIITIQTSFGHEIPEDVDAVAQFVPPQDILAYHRRSAHRLAPGLYLGYLKLSSSVDQIRILVSQRTPNMLCHTRIRDNANVSRDEWDWIQSLSAAGETEPMEAGPKPEGHAPFLLCELQLAIRSLLRLLNVPVHQARRFRLYSQEVIELGGGVSFLLLLPTPDLVCSAPGQANPYGPLGGFLHLPLQMFELGHLCAYRERFVGLYCRLSSVLDLDALITQQALREAISNGEVSTAQQRHQLVLDYIQQLDEMRRDLRWITDALQNARCKPPRGGVPISLLVDTSLPQTDSASSALDDLATPSPSPELPRQNAISDSLLSDEDASSEVFLPTDSDYDSSDALSPREPDLLGPPGQDLSQEAVFCQGGGAPDVLRPPQLRSTCPKDPSPNPPPTNCCRTVPTSLPPPGPPALFDTTHTLEGLSLSRTPPPGVTAPAKRRLLSRSNRGGQYFSGPQRWLMGHGTGGPSLSEGVYTQQLPQELPPPHGAPTFVSHASCTLENRRLRDRGPRTHVRRIFVEPSLQPSLSNKRSSWEEPEAAVVPVVMETGGKEPEAASNQEVDSDDQTNSLVSEILSSAL